MAPSHVKGRAKMTKCNETIRWTHPHNGDDHQDPCELPQGHSGAHSLCPPPIDHYAVMRAGEALAKELQDAAEGMHTEYCGGDFESCRNFECVRYRTALEAWRKSSGK